MSARTRVLLIVAGAAAAAAAIVVGATLATRSHPPKQRAAPVQLAPRKGAPPLVLDLGVRGDAAARAIRRASVLYEAGKRAQAGALFARYPDLNAQVGAALSGWPTGTIERLQALAAAHPRSSVVQLNLGLADFWAGKGPQALAAWRDAVRADPDSASAVHADDLLHPGFPRGLPLFVPSFPSPSGLDKLPPDRQLAELGRRARARDVEARLLYGAALQRVGRPVSAERAFASAEALAPDDPEAQVAAAIGRFSKEHPERAFSRLGPLARRFPHATTVRFHLGLLLLWIGQVDPARRELRQAVKDGPATSLGREAALFLKRLRAVRTG
jgi:tetratricopeptide (TPR) repeat protein